MYNTSVENFFIIKLIKCAFEFSFKKYNYIGHDKDAKISVIFIYFRFEFADIQILKILDTPINLSA